MQRVEKRRALHRQPEAATGNCVVAHVENSAAGFCVGAIEPVDPAAEGKHGRQQAERVQHRQSRRLQHQAGTDRRGHVEAFEDFHPMPLPRQHQRRREPRRAGARNADIKCLHGSPR
ncbi:hypothetical protein D9M70_567500 [compost metagenome]